MVEHFDGLVEFDHKMGNQVEPEAAITGFRFGTFVVDRVDRICSFSSAVTLHKRVLETEMKSLIAVLIVLTGVLILPVPASSQNTETPDNDSTVVRGNNRAVPFVDANGDGYNDNAPDHDGDGIPNGLDPDFLAGQRGRRFFVDANGDGINDYAPDHDNDGIPNGMDPDFRGPMTRNGGRGFIDVDGDGVLDGRGRRRGRGMGFGSGAQAGPEGATPGSGCGDCSIPQGPGPGGRKGKR